MDWLGPQRVRVHLRLALFLSWLPVFAATAGENDLPYWVPSLGIGAGIQSREIDASIDAILFDGTLAATRIVPCGSSANPPLPGGYCDLSSAENRALDGGALDVSAQLLGPPLESVFLRPRPFLFGRFDLAFDSRTVAEKGSNPSSFEDNLQEADIRTRLRGNPEYFWYVGGGVALQMPIEWTPVFVKIGAHYMQDRVDVTGQIDRSQGAGTLTTTEFTDELTTPGVGPSLGLEAQIARFGPVSLDFVADVLFSFPLSGTHSQFGVEQPTFGGDPPRCSVNPVAGCLEPADFNYDADSVHYFGVAALRFSWIGF